MGKYFRDIERDAAQRPVAKENRRDWAGAKHKQTSLENALANAAVKKYKGDGTLDVEGTNAARIRAALEGRLIPVKTKGSVVRYRDISKDNDGLLRIGYSLTVRKDMLALSGSEVAPILVVAKSFGMKGTEIRALIASGAVRGSIETVNLSDINRLKFGPTGNPLSIPL